MEIDAQPTSHAGVDDPLAGDLELDPQDAERVTGGGEGDDITRLCRVCRHTIGATHHSRMSGGYYCSYPTGHYCAA